MHPASIEHASRMFKTWCLTAGRLDDKAALVRKAALHLIGAMTAANPFGPFLNINAFQGSLEEQRQKLKVSVAPFEDRFPRPSMCKLCAGVCLRIQVCMLVHQVGLHEISQANPAKL